MFTPRTTIAIVGVLAASLALAGCTGTGMNMDMGGSTAPSASAVAFNDQDVAFAQEMIVHHQGAIDMAQVVLDKQGIDQAVTDLAQTIKDAQGPEIDLMTSWLDAWGQPVDMSGSMPGMDMGASSMPMDMTALEAATGVDASRMFLEQMTVHHQGAIAMAQIELTDGQNSDAVALAQKIVDDQTAEIDVMASMLAAL